MTIQKKFLPLQPFVIAINGLKQGSSRFDWRADGKFFGNFENSDILDADLSVVAEVEKSSRYFGVDCSVRGKVQTVCDRCLETLWLEVDTEFKLSVKFGDAAESTDSDDREIVMIPEGEAELDLSQAVYDYVCTSLPMRRVHPDGECDPAALRYLNSETRVEEAPAAAQSPFAALKDILK